MDLCNEFVASEARMSGSFAGPRPVPTVSAHIIKKSLGQSSNSPMNIVPGEPWSR